MRRVVITGVSRGLGAALLDRLLDLPDTAVTAIGRRFTEEQRSGAGERLTLLTADLSDPAALPSVERLAAALDGGQDAVLLHNAGVIQPVGPIGTLPAGELAAAVAVNLTAPMLLTNAFLAAVPASTRRVRLLFISSGAAHRPIEGWSAYCTTKAGAEAFFAVVSAEAARRDPRVTVGVISPGVIDTDMQATLRAAEFPEHDRFVRWHRSGELRSPRVVAAEIVAQHITNG